MAWFGISVFTAIHADTLGSKYYVFLVTNKNIASGTPPSCSQLHILKNKSLANTTPGKIHKYETLTA